jgi:hypothetical protein
MAMGAVSKQDFSLKGCEDHRPSVISHLMSAQITKSSDLWITAFMIPPGDVPIAHSLDMHMKVAVWKDWAGFLPWRLRVGIN